MLVLSRKPGQKIQIGNDVTLVVLGISGKTIRFGFEGPPEIPIHRSEVAERLAGVSAEAAPMLQQHESTAFVPAG